MTRRMSLSEQLTYSTTKITAYTSTGESWSGTGYFMNLCNDGDKVVPVIITNKHVANNANKIVIALCKADNDMNPIDQERFEISYNGINVINHPEQNVDLCALPIAHIENELRNKNIKLFKIPLDISLLPTENDIKEFSAMEEIIMIGYPDGIEDTFNNKPVIRRGITSTHIKHDYMGRKEFLIDMACFPGSSGSPIFICNENSYSQNGNIYMGSSRIKLLGTLYAGPSHIVEGHIVFDFNPKLPISRTNIPNNLGLVIKAERIKELENEIMKII